MASEIVPFTPYTPNWALITKVLGTKQAEYDRGFNMVKNVYDSVLNSPLTNEDNKKFRTEAFKKLQNSLKSVAAVDLSNPTNVMRAQELMNPISQDKDFAYDIYWTDAQQKQEQLMNQVKNSTDPKVNSQYNENSALDLQLAAERMRNAKRGDGSIQNISPGEFVPYQDYIEELDKIAKEAELKIEVDHTTPDGYKITDINGKQAEPSFTRWALSHLGPKYDRQFNQMGRVKSELEIRNLMQNNKLSREDAASQIAKGITDSAVQSYSKEIDGYQSALDQVNDEIEKFKTLYPNNKVPKTNQNVQEEYAQLVKLKSIYEEQLKGSKTEMDKIAKDGPAYFAGNLSGYYSGDLKKTAAYEWGSSRAAATVGKKIDEDQIWITNKNNQIKVMLDNARLNMDAAELRFNMHKLDIESGFKEAELALKQKELAMKAAGLGGGGTGSGASKADKNKFQPDQWVGNYTAAGDNAISAVDVLNKTTSNFRERTYNLSFGASDGLINLVIKPEDFNSVNTSMYKLKEIGEGKDVKLTVNDLVTLKTYAAKIGVNPKAINARNSQEANYLIDMMAYQTYLKASENIKTHVKFDKAGKISNVVKNFKPTLDAFKSLDDESGRLALTNYNISEFIAPGGVLKPEFSNAVLIRKQGDYGIYDTRSFTPEQKKQLEYIVDRDLVSRQNATGNSYTINGITQPEVQQLLNAKTKLTFSENAARLKSILTNDENIKSGKFGIDQLQELFGGTAQADFDPVSRTAKLTFHVDPTSDIAKAKGVNITSPEAVSIVLDYDEIEASRSGLLRLQSIMQGNVIDTRISRIANEFAKHPFGTLSSDSWMNNYGFKYNLAGTKHGSQQIYGLNLNLSILDPKTRTQITKSGFIPVKNPNDPNSFREIQEKIDRAYNDYVITRAAYENSFDADEEIDLNDLFK